MTADDWIIFGPGDVDLAQSPLRNGIGEETFVLGAFNPALTRLGNGNLLLIVRVAEALAQVKRGGAIRQIRWTEAGYTLDSFPADSVDLSDSRAFTLTDQPNRPFGLTSLSWLLPVEISADAREVVKVHYDKAIAPAAPYQAYGLEDARVSLIGGSWYLTCCAVSPERQGTALYVSVNGLDYRPMGLILDHQNKDMVLFEGRVAQKFMALTRPLGSGWPVFPPDSADAAGPAIHFAQSPDALHWRPLEASGIRPRKGMAATRLGGGAQPILTTEGWLVLYHGVQADGGIGTYRTYWALLDREDPSRVLHQADTAPLIEPMPALTAGMADARYLDSPVVFTTGVVDAGDHYLIASGEADLACRISRVAKDALRASA